MNIIVVDNERSALWELEQAIGEALPDAIVSCFQSSEQALSYLKEATVDIAFLDIEMPKINGLALAKRIKDIYGKTNIVFVTGYPQYAVNAFSVAASGYLLKPVVSQDIKNALQTLRYPLSLSQKGVSIQTFGVFDIAVDGNSLLFARSKSREILAYLVHKRGNPATRREMAEILWPEEEYTRSKQAQLQTILSEMLRPLREAGVDGIIRKSRAAYSIDPQQMDCDYYRLLTWDAAAINQYQGEYMPDYPWARMQLEGEQEL